MKNTIKSLANGDFEVSSLDDPKFLEAQRKRKVIMDEYSGLPAVDDYIDPLEEYRKQAMELWNDSCTSVRGGQSTEKS